MTDPSTYAHWVTERVRFSDTDAMGHVNNVALAAYVESGRVTYGMGLSGEVDEVLGQDGPAPIEGPRREVLEVELPG